MAFASIWGWAGDP